MTTLNNITETDFYFDEVEPTARYSSLISFPDVVTRSNNLNPSEGTILGNSTVDTETIMTPITTTDASSRPTSTSTLVNITETLMDASTVVSITGTLTDTPTTERSVVGDTTEISTEIPTVGGISTEASTTAASAIFDEFIELFSLDTANLKTILGYLMLFALFISILFFIYNVIFFRTRNSNYLAPFGSSGKRGTNILFTITNTIPLVSAFVILVLLPFSDLSFEIYKIFLVGGLINILILFICFVLLFVQLEQDKLRLKKQNMTIGWTSLILLIELLAVISIYVIIGVYQSPTSFNTVLYSCLTVEAIIRTIFTYIVLYLMIKIVRTMEEVKRPQGLYVADPSAEVATDRVVTNAVILNFTNDRENNGN